VQRWTNENSGELRSLDSRGRLSLREILMTRSLVLALFLFSGCLLSAQEPASAAHASSIAGTVAKEPGSQPLKKVLVQIVAENQKEGGNYTASTDADGHFHIENVLPGVTVSSSREPGLSG